MQIININKQAKALLKYKLSLSRLCINLFGISLLFMPFLSFAESLPKSTITNNTETFQLSCPDNDPQGNTIEMMKCYTTKIEQLNAVEAKYIAAIYSRINTEQRDNPERLNLLISSIVNENNRWDELIEAASLSMYNHWIDGSVRNLVGAQREIELKKYRIHNQWQSWLTYADSSGILPEPLFIEVNNTATE